MCYVCAKVPIYIVMCLLLLLYLSAYPPRVHLHLLLYGMPESSGAADLGLGTEELELKGSCAEIAAAVFTMIYSIL